MSKCDVCLFEKGGDCYSMIECENFNLFYPVIEKAEAKGYEVRLAGPKLKVNKGMLKGEDDIKEFFDGFSKEIEKSIKEDMIYEKGDKVLVEIRGKEETCEILSRQGFKHYQVLILDENIKFITNVDYINGKVLAGPCDPGEKGVEEEKKYMKTWEAIKALEEGKKVRSIEWIGNMYLVKEGDLIVDEKGVIVNINWFKCDWEIYEEPKEEIKNCCKVCAYRYKLQTGDIMCCKKIGDTKDSNYCGEFAYNEPSNDYVKAMIKLLEVVKGV